MCLGFVWTQYGLGFIRRRGYTLYTWRFVSLCGNGRQGTREIQRSSREASGEDGIWSSTKRPWETGGSCLGQRSGATPGLNPQTRNFFFFIDECRFLFFSIFLNSPSFFCLIFPTCVSSKYSNPHGFKLKPFSVSFIFPLKLFRGKIKGEALGGSLLSVDQDCCTSTPSFVYRFSSYIT